MNASSKLVCLVAAGGTAGHVRPALAVAEALRDRGVKVTFAGSADRVESQLVPEAGFELDTFSISGLPAPFRARPRCARSSRPSRAPFAVPAHPRTPPAGRRPRRRWLRGRADGARGSAPGHSVRPHGSGRAPRPCESAGRSACASCVPRVRDRGPRREEVPRRRTADPAVAPRRSRAARRGCASVFHSTGPSWPSSAVLRARRRSTSSP